MKVHLDYGDEGLIVEAPDGSGVIEPHRRPALPDPDLELRRRLREPTSGDIAEKGNTVASSVCERTRPQPRNEMLEELRAAGAANPVPVLMATGTHRADNSEELERNALPARHGRSWLWRFPDGLTADPVVLFVSASWSSMDQLGRAAGASNGLEPAGWTE